MYILALHLLAAVLIDKQWAGCANATGKQMKGIWFRFLKTEAEETFNRSSAHPHWSVSG